MLLAPRERWKLFEGDCIPHMHEMPKRSVDFSIFSPPFPAVYSYSSSPADLGNSEDLHGEGKLHLSFFFHAIRRVIKPGRVMIVHCWNLPRLKKSGGQGLSDFRGLLIRLGERAGFIYEYDWLIRKNPQSEAIRTKSRELSFDGMESDRAKCRGSLPDYLLKFRAPGNNKVPVNSVNEVSRDNWILWAESHWDDIKQTKTLNIQEGRGKDDTRHICPLQLEVIRRMVLLYTNPGEVVFSPFAGIGSELYQSLRLGRRAYGCELKPEYAGAARKNCRRAEQSEEKSLIGVQ